MVRLARSLLAATLLVAGSLQAQTPQAQIDQSRQFSSPLGLNVQPQRGVTDIAAFGSTAAPDDAFGAQVILKEQSRAKPFSAFAEIAGFLTNNVALVSRGEQDDKFLVASAGAAFSHRLGYNLRFDTGARVSIFRYSEFNALDFQSVDLSAGITWTPPQLKGTEVVARYTFTDLTTADGGDEFYKNHAVLLGLQKVYPLARAHAIYGGVSAQWSFADPEEAGRDEYSAFLGYRVQLTRKVEADLFYRYGYFDYRESELDRRDHHQALSFTVRYAPAEWVALSASSFAGFNRSNEEAFDYEVLNAGLGLQVSIRF